MIFVNVPTDASLGTLLNFGAVVTPDGFDVNTENNSRVITCTVVGSFDPNMIEVYPQRTGNEGYIAANALMTYTIHFQNTGTAPAINVNIANTIDEHLDISTVQVIGSSHDMHTEVLTGNTLNFIFDDIMLEDSTTNEPESHGYVIYTIQQMPDLAPGTEMTNTAEIYFDFNEAVVTNTVLNTIAFPENISELNGNAISVYPNPADEFVTIRLQATDLYEVSLHGTNGQLISSQKFRGELLRLDTHALTPGLYHVSAVNKAGSISTRLLIIE